MGANGIGDRSLAARFLTAAGDVHSMAVRAASEEGLTSLEGAIESVSAKMAKLWRDAQREASSRRDSNLFTAP